MPKLPPFALADTAPRPQRPWYLLAFLGLFAIPLYGLHWQLLNLPYFWDECGQFVPTALDILRHGWWVTKSAVPNVHPPGVEAYLALWYWVLGYSIPVTRVAMLALASLGLLMTFLLAIRLSADSSGAPAFWPPLFLLASPLFFMQSFMAQLDMPAMVLTLVAVSLFLKGRYREAALASVVLVLAKETSLVTPFVFFLILLWRREWKSSLLFAAPAIALGIWLVVLHRATGYWLGDPGFAHYNVAYSLHPVRMVFSLLRRLFYLFIAEFRWIGTLALIVVWKRCVALRSADWIVVYAVVAANVLIVSLLGGAELERYLLPVLPFFYIACSVAFASLRSWVGRGGIAVLAAGLVVSIFWNPPYPFPYENNYAMVDFVRLQQTAADFADRSLGDKRIATAWPLTAALRNPDYGFVQRKHKILETGDFHAGSIKHLAPYSYDALIVYTRTWAPAKGVISIPWVRSLLARFYEWQPDISFQECAALGLTQSVSWTSRGQNITLYTR
jgi:hypothetical protein